MLKRQQPELTRKNLTRAKRMLFDVIELFEQEKIDYHLEGGTLLGIVRDKELLPWDHDVDVSIPFIEVNKLTKGLFSLYMKGYKITIRKSKNDSGSFQRGDYILFKVKKLVPSVIKWAFPWYHKNYIVLDIFVKKDDSHFTYWQAQGKLLRVEKSHYSSFETVEYMSSLLRVPVDYRSYLTKKYGDWSIPVKVWECRSNEGTIVGN